ncbi:unnamed protein product [Closterium sp. Yama58-4]|nr:unnamed protein product [Closterium sp. Yama58-4]
METSMASEDTRAGGRSRRVSQPPAYLRSSYQLTMPRGRLSNGKRGATVPKRLSLSNKGKEVTHSEQDDGTGAESADSSERSEEEDEESKDTSASGSHEESADLGAGGKTNDDGCAGISAANADMRTHQDARDTDVARGDGRGQADGLVGRTRVNTLDANGDDVRIPSRILEQLIQAQDKSAKENARLEALFLNAMSRPSGGSRKRKAQKQRDPGQGCMNPKRQRGETWSGGSDGDGEDDDDDTHGSGGRHMRTAKSPILQRALEHLPTDKAWKRVCELARVHMFLNRPTSTMTFYPSSDDKTHGVCAVLDRLPHSFACLALAADKSRRANLNKTLSEWKTRAAARVRDIALPKLGLFRDDSDCSATTGTHAAHGRPRRHAVSIRSGSALVLALTPLVSAFYHSREGYLRTVMLTTPWLAAADTDSAHVVCRNPGAHELGKRPRWHDVCLPGIRDMCEGCIQAQEGRAGDDTEGVPPGLVGACGESVSDCVLYWEERKGRLSNSAGGNAHVVDGLKVLVKEAVERAIRIRNPEYDAEREAWIWGRHGLRISACGLEHMKPTAAAQSEEPAGDDDLSASVGDEFSPNANPGIDATISTIAHEIAEAATDPDASTGWLDTDKEENADKCSYTYRKTKSVRNKKGKNAKYNLVGLHNMKFMVQQIWDFGTDSCVSQAPE